MKGRVSIAPLFNFAPLTTTTITHSYGYCPYLIIQVNHLCNLCQQAKRPVQWLCILSHLSNAATFFGPMGGSIKRLPLSLWIITVSIWHIPIDAVSDPKWENSSSTCSIINRILQLLKLPLYGSLGLVSLMNSVSSLLAMLYRVPSLLLILLAGSKG